MWQNYLKEYLNKLYENKSNLDEFRSFKTDYQRVFFCLNKLKYPNEKHFHDLCKSYEIKDKNKNLKTSDNYRKIGNSFYKKKEFQDSFNNYNLAIKYAGKNTDQYLLAYSNRSALYYEMKLYKECLEDLNQIKSLNLNLIVIKSNNSILYQSKMKIINIKVF